MFIKLSFFWEAVSSWTIHIHNCGIEELFAERVVFVIFNFPTQDRCIAQYLISMLYCNEMFRFGICQPAIIWLDFKLGADLMHQF